MIFGLVRELNRRFPFFCSFNIPRKTKVIQKFSIPQNFITASGKIYPMNQLMEGPGALARRKVCAIVGIISYFFQKKNKAIIRPLSFALELSHVWKFRIRLFFLHNRYCMLNLHQFC